MTSQKRTIKRICLWADQEFQQNEIKKLNKKFSVDILSTKIRGGTAFGAEQKICELKKRISKLKRIKSKSKVIMPTMLIKKATDIMN